VTGDKKTEKKLPCYDLGLFWFLPCIFCCSHGMEWSNNALSKFVIAGSLTEVRRLSSFLAGFNPTCIFWVFNRSGISWCGALIHLWAPSPIATKEKWKKRWSTCVKPKMTTWTLSSKLNKYFLNPY